MLSKSVHGDIDDIFAVASSQDSFISPIFPSIQSCLVHNNLSKESPQSDVPRYGWNIPVISTGSLTFQGSVPSYNASINNCLVTDSFLHCSIFANNMMTCNYNTQCMTSPEILPSGRISSALVNNQLYNGLYQGAITIRDDRFPKHAIYPHIPAPNFVSNNDIECSLLDGGLMQPFSSKAIGEDGGNLIDLNPRLSDCEYLTLDSFDPLCDIDRRQLVDLTNSCHVDSSSRIGFPPQNLMQHFQQESHKMSNNSTNEDCTSSVSPIALTEHPLPSLIGLESFVAEQMLGSSNSDFVSGHLGDDVANVSELSEFFKDKPSGTVLQSSVVCHSSVLPKIIVGYEKLQRRTVVDSEMDAFHQMLIELRRDHVPISEGINPGYLLSPLHTCRTPSMQVKLIVFLPHDLESVAFTCDTDTTTEHVISQVLYNSYQMQVPHHSSDNYLLKVYDRTEYLCSDVPLSKFEYVHNCLNRDVDLKFEMVLKDEVPRPFLYTENAQCQTSALKEFEYGVNTVTIESLEILLGTFHRLLADFSGQVSSAVHVQVYKLRQSLKAVCTILAGVETIGITDGVAKLESLISAIANSSFHSTSANWNGDHRSLHATDVTAPCCAEGELQTAVDRLVEAVADLVRMYCVAHRTKFFLSSSLDMPCGEMDVATVRDKFTVHIATGHWIMSTMQAMYEFKVSCALYHGTHQLCPDFSTSCQVITTKGFCPRVIWDERLRTDIFLTELPREARLCVTLLAVCNSTASERSPTADPSARHQDASPVGSATFQLYSENGHLIQGCHLVPLDSGKVADPIIPSCMIPLSDSTILLQLNFPDFGRTVFFPPLLADSVEWSTMPFEHLPPETQETICNIVSMDCSAVMDVEEMETLWQYRHCLTDKTALLPRILQSKAVRGWDWASLPELKVLLDNWPLSNISQAVELLLPQYPDMNVREFASRSLAQMPADDLIHFLPQLTQALKYESYHSSPLAMQLLKISFCSVRFAHHFFWLLKGVVSHDPNCKHRYHLMLMALAGMAGSALYKELCAQEGLVNILTSVAEKVKVGKDKETILREDLIDVCNYIEKKGSIALPYNPSLEVSGIDLKSCSFFASNSFPLKLVFRNSSNPKADPIYTMFKVGDDLRQDMLTLQMMRIMDMLWQKEHLQLKMLFFSCLATGQKKGMVELITGSETLRKIQALSGITGSFKERTIKDWLQKHNPTELQYNKAVENFTLSCAGYSVATYVLGVGDRHNDNVMLTESGHMFHIDFSKFLGDVQMFGSIKRDRVPFVLTPDMAYVINDGEAHSSRFQRFMDTCCQAFNILREHTDLFRSLFMLVSTVASTLHCVSIEKFVRHSVVRQMSRSGIPGVTERAVTFVHRALLPGLTKAQATSTFTRLMEESLKSLSTQFNFFIHTLAQHKFSSHSEGALFSFIPRTYSLKMDGRITRVAMISVQKRYTPEKHYVYIMAVERERQRVPSNVFRLFEECVEFRDRMVSVYPLIVWPNFSTRMVIGRSNVRSVAESRKAEIVSFLTRVWSSTSEICECDLVYTFFHPLLRDEQETFSDQHLLCLPKLRAISPASRFVSSGVQGKIKLSVQHRQHTLSVMVMHVTDLAHTDDLPSVYVKTYLLPDVVRHSKRKTRIIRNNAHPTFNQLVTVWHHDVMKGNSLLGAIYIALKKLDLSDDTARWYRLGKLQLTGS